MIGLESSRVNGPSGSLLMMSGSRIRSSAFGPWLKRNVASAEALGHFAEARLRLSPWVVTATLVDHPPLTVQIAMAGALPVWRDFMVVPANVYEGLVGGSEWLSVTALQNDVSISGATMTVKKTDGSTTQYTKTITTAAGDPVVGLD